MRCDFIDRFRFLVELLLQKVLKLLVYMVDCVPKERNLILHLLLVMLMRSPLVSFSVLIYCLSPSVFIFLFFV